ncbi:hypothetical protein [Hyphomonas sp.]|uniref:CC0125/CC1285 family lipoprotein n=1 Tax=Hyphomonas sp. TaxID=87 RepID=UPI000DF90539|nr:hypothetical protein [Hyphomonas sp.]RCL88812.1 MAG: hypothetical protein DBW63_03470 [Hyphomonas sp.]
MPKFKLTGAIAALAVLGACATATPYQAALDGDRGYSEMKIEDNRFQVEFSGNSLTDRKTVETYLLYRAAELTRLNGYDHFRVLRRDTDSESRLVPVGGGSPYYDHFHLNYRYFGPYAAYYHDPFRRSRYSAFGPYDAYWGGPREYRERTSYVASAEILMGKGEKPADAAYFDAEQVVFNLSSNIMRPELE